MKEHIEQRHRLDLLSSTKTYLMLMAMEFVSCQLCGCRCHVVQELDSIRVVCCQASIRKQVMGKPVESGGQRMIAMIEHRPDD